MHEALAMVRRELGPDAALLHTRPVRSRWLRWLPGPQQIEVTASRDVNGPSRLRPRVSSRNFVELPSPRPPARVMEGIGTNAVGKGRFAEPCGPDGRYLATPIGAQMCGNIGKARED
jgi:hypothetical protein